MTVEDPEGYWRSPELECSRNDMIASMINDYAAPLSGTEGNPESLARDRIKSLEPDDAVFTVGYPEAEYRQIGIERDSSLVAVVNFSLIPDGGWLLGGYDACDSAQIRV